MGLQMISLLLAAVAWAAPAPVLTARYTYDAAGSIDEGLAVAVGAGGDVFVAGRVSNGCGGTGDVYVGRFDAYLNKKWEVIVDVGTCADNYPMGLAVSGDVSYVCGRGAGSPTDGFVVKVDGNGNKMWEHVDATFDGFHDILVSPQDGAVCAVGSRWYAFPTGRYWGSVLQLLDQGATASDLGRGDFQGTTDPVFGYSLGWSTNAAGRLAIGGLTQPSSGPSSAWMFDYLPKNAAGCYVKSLAFYWVSDEFGGEECYALLARTSPGTSVELLKSVPHYVWSDRARVTVHWSGSGSFGDIGRVVVHPRLPLVVVADGPVLKGYDTSLNEYWTAPTAGFASPTFHGAALAGGMSYTLYAALGVAGAGGTALAVVRYDAVDPLKAAGKLTVAPNVVDRRGSEERETRPYVIFGLKGSPAGSVSLRIYDAAGNLNYTLPVTLDSTGRAEYRWRVELRSGVYWVVAQGGGVNDKKPFSVVSDR